MSRLLRIIIGSLLLVLGVIGLFVPILQGVLFLGLGGLLLYRDIPYLPRLVNWLRKRFPAFDRVVENVKRKFHRKGQKTQLQVTREGTHGNDD